MKAYLSALGIGLGHVSRSLTLAKRLKDYGLSVAISSYGDALKFLKEQGDVTVFDGGREISWVMGPYGSPDLIRTLKNVKEIPKFIEHIKVEISNISDFAPDVVISDSRISTVIAAKMADIPAVVLLNQPKLLISPLVDEALYKMIRRFYSSRMKKIPELIEKALNTAMTTLWAASESALIVDFPPPDNISKAQTSDLPMRILSKATFTGPLIEVSCERTPVEDVILIIVSGPKAERRSLANDLRSMSKELAGAFPEYRIVISLGEPGSTEVIEEGNLTIYGWLPHDKKWEYISRASLIVSRAGHTTISEALLCGKPLVLIPTPKHTEKMENAKSVHSKGLGKIVKQEDVRRELIQAIRSVLSDHRMKERVLNFMRRYEEWDFLDRAVGPILSSMR